VKYSDSEIVFASTIQKTLLGKTPAIESASQVEPFGTESRKGGSTDVGDVSWTAPTVGCRVATWVPGTPSHSWQAVACGGTDIGYKGMMVAAKTIALTGYDFIKNPEWVKQAKSEWLKARGDNFKYESLLGNRKPALDYRD
jgi:aminobenzoyl-glutamate utilization protein B